MLGALGGTTIIALILNRNRFKPAVFTVWLMSAVIMWLHEFGVNL